MILYAKVINKRFAVGGNVSSLVTYLVKGRIELRSVIILNTCISSGGMMNQGSSDEGKHHYMGCDRIRPIDHYPFDREKFPLGMAYVPLQESLRMYENLQKAYCSGTIFPSLDKPFTGRRCVR